MACFLPRCSKGTLYCGVKSHYSDAPGSAKEYLHNGLTPPWVRFELNVGPWRADPNCLVGTPSGTDPAILRLLIETLEEHTGERSYAEAQAEVIAPVAASSSGPAVKGRHGKTRKGKK